MELNMRIYLFLTSFLLASGSPALAGWIADFSSTYTEHGIDRAIIRALEEGAAPEQIVETALPLPDLHEANLVKALFCALAQPDTVKNAAATHGISEKTINDGYQLALAECARQMAENLNSALDSSSRFPGSTYSSGEARGTNYASPWKFN